MSKFLDFVNELPSDLKTYERIILITIRGMIEDHGDNVFPAYDTLAQLTGMSERQAIKIVQRLVDRGLLVKTERTVKKSGKYRQLSNSYTLSTALMSHTSEPCEQRSDTLGDPSAQRSPYKSSSLKALKQEEEYINSGSAVFESEILRNQIPKYIRNRILIEINDLYSYSSDAIIRAFKKAILRQRYGSGLYNFAKWFATTLRNEQFYLLQQELAG
jgi:hypothetical protein